jgi:hypothetical protein
MASSLELIAGDAWRGTRTVAAQRRRHWFAGIVMRRTDKSMFSDHMSFDLSS